MTSPRTGALLVLLAASGCGFREELNLCIETGVCIAQDYATQFVETANGQPLGSFRLDPGAIPERRVEWLPAPDADRYQFQAAPCPSGPLAQCPFDADVVELEPSAPRVTLDLPPVVNGNPYVGRYAYRVRPCRGSGDRACGRWTPVRYFRAGHPAGPVPGDLDRDGRVDAVVGDPGASANLGEVTLFEWSSSSFVPRAIETSLLDGRVGFGTSVAHLGDVNADGVGDLLVAGAPGDTAYLVLGGDPPSAPLPLASQGGGFPASVAAAGDFNGDGFADAVISKQASGTASFLLYLGTADGLQATPDATLAPPAGGGDLGLSVAAVDLDLDARDDLVVSSVAGTGKVYVYPGQTVTAGAVLFPKHVLGAADGDLQFGKTVTAAGDVDGDGVEEVLVRGGADSYHLLGAGSPTPLLRSGSANIEYGSTAAGYLNGDAFADAMFFRLGSFEIQFGSPEGLLDTEFSGTDETVQPRAAVAGDLNGDGTEDVVARVITSGVSEVQVFFSLEHRERIAQPAGGSNHFGAALAPIR